MTAERLPGAPEELGGGARFWAYISPENNTAELVTWWRIVLTQGNWTGEMTSEGDHNQLQTPGLSGEFQVEVTAKVGPNLQPQRLSPADDSKPDVGCNDNCAAMIGIVADSDSGETARYWTVWDAVCDRGNQQH